eukprot:2515782-Pleurochrysis_carterae.AAC.1
MRSARGLSAQVDSRHKRDVTVGAEHKECGNSGGGRSNGVGCNESAQLLMDPKQLHASQAQPARITNTAATTTLTWACANTPVSYTHLTLPTILLV